MNNRLPKISIVTPSFNQAEFLEDTILSIVTQNYPNIDYVIIDGGSEDCSIEIIRKYEDRITYWASEPDRGQYEAINKGFAKTSGEIMAWLNSDDKFTPWAFSVVGEIFSKFPQVEWITSLYPIEWDEHGRAVKCFNRVGYSRKGFFRGENLANNVWYSNDWIQQESTFWRRSLWQRAGGYVDSSLDYAGDFELWARFFQYSELYGVTTPLGGFRRHRYQKTANHISHYIKEAEQILLNYGGRPYSKIASIFRVKLFRLLPLPYRIIATKLGLLNTHKAFINRDGEWELTIF